MWRQKSRELWLKEGDKNMGYFHIMVNAHNRRSWITNMKIGEQWITDEVIKEVIVWNFEN